MPRLLRLRRLDILFGCCIGISVRQTANDALDFDCCFGKRLSSFVSQHHLENMTGAGRRASLVSQTAYNHQRNSNTKPNPLRERDRVYHQFTLPYNRSVRQCCWLYRQSHIITDSRASVRFAEKHPSHQNSCQGGDRWCSAATTSV